MNEEKKREGGKERKENGLAALLVMENEESGLAHNSQGHLPALGLGIILEQHLQKKNKTIM